MLVVSADFPASVSSDYLLIVSRAVKSGPGNLYVFIGKSLCYCIGLQAQTVHCVGLHPSTIVQELKVVNLFLSSD